MQGLRLIWPLAAAAVLFGCSNADGGSLAAEQAATAPAAPTPAPAAGAIDDAALTGFVQATYDGAASLQKPWHDPGSNAELQVCARDTMAIDGQPHALLAVCGRKDDFGHVTSGLNHFYLLAAGAQGPEVIASSRDGQFGSMGSAGRVEILRLGSDLYGFSVQGGGSGQGYTTATRTLLLPDDGGFVEAASFRSHLDNNGHMEGCLERGSCQPDEAYDLDFELQVDDSDPGASAYPLVVEESGRACGEPASDQYRLTLDTATLRYPVPEALQRDGHDCETTAAG